jgi:hypothetical protein
MGFKEAYHFLGIGMLVNTGLSSRAHPLSYDNRVGLTMSQLIPQIVVNYRRHHATGLQSSMMMLWAWAGVPLGVYNIVEEFNIALRIQPQILILLSLVTWIQCYYYQRVRHSSCL